MAAGRLRRRDFTLLARLVLVLLRGSFLHNLNHFQFPLLGPFLFARIFAQTPILVLDIPLFTVLFFWKLTAGSEERETNAAGGAVHAHENEIERAFSNHPTQHTVSS